ncbi:Caprin-1 [Atta colombica]|uniref:Caprin-1 n=1 Tax=Atta colombica TaxID=520822 RepID=A0A195BG86_9HYME|nr:Caprin-1 [Atta colombica]
MLAIYPPTRTLRPASRVKCQISADRTITCQRHSCLLPVKDAFCQPQTRKTGLYGDRGSVTPSDRRNRAQDTESREAGGSNHIEICKVKEVLLAQHVLISINTDSVRDDFFHGKNGAIKLTEEEFKYLDNLYNEIVIKNQREEGDLTFVQQAQKVAEHYVAIVDGKQREVIGTTYNKLKEIIAKINQCGYFDQYKSDRFISVQITETVAETKITNAQTAQEQVNEEYSNGNDRHIPPESMIPIPNFPVQVTTLPVVSAQQSQQQPPPAPRINDVIGTPNFFFLQESELDSDVTSQTPIVSHIPPTVNAPIPSQTFTNQNFANAPVGVPQQVIYQHQPPQDMSHIPGFANPNPPPPIPMPPSHQQPNMQYSPQHPTSFQPQQPQQQNTAQLPQQGQMQNFNEQTHQQEAQTSTEEKIENGQNEIPDPSLEQQNESIDWCQMTETNDWNQSDQQQQSVQDCQQASQQTSQQTWVPDQRGGYRGRGGRRGTANSYNSRGRGNYQQNGRAGQGTYYRNDNNYQNGYQQRAWGNNEGNNGYNSGFKRGSGGGSRGARNDRVSRGQFRGQRGNNRGYAPRGKPHTQ